MSDLLLPPALPAGGTLGIVAPASAAPLEDLRLGVTALEALGYRVVLGEHVNSRYGHLAGPDAARAADLHAMFERPDIDAVVCSRGGSGSIRLLNRIDWDLLAAHPKPFLGYSDLTVFELALLRRCRIPSFFAPMVASDFSKPLLAPCLDLLRRLIGDPCPAGEVSDPRCAEAITLVGGTAEGPCVGGTLSLVVATLGTPYAIDLEGCIFFFEDVYESPAHIERYLMQLMLAGQLERAAGFLIGSTPYEASGETRARYLPVEQVYRDLLAPLGKPLVHGWPHGHDPSPMPLPMGIRIRLDADRKRLTIVDPAVRRPAQRHR